MTFARALLQRTTESLVPSHLSRAYPADFSLFLAALVLVLYYLPLDSMAAAALVVAGVLAAVLLFLGWALDSQRLTTNGSLLSVGLWAGQIAALFADSPGLSSQAWVAFLLSAIAHLNLAVGVWWLLPVPAEADRIGERRWSGQLSG